MNKSVTHKMDRSGTRASCSRFPPLKTKMKEGGEKKTDKKTRLPARLNSNPDYVCLGLHLSPTSTPHLPVPATSRELGSETGPFPSSHGK